MIKVEILADSVAAHGGRLTTFRLQYPRFIHSELMTHRVFSRNAASSRAIPFDRMVAMIKEEPAMPVKWGSKQPGMQSGTEVGSDIVGLARRVWLGAMKGAISQAIQLDTLGIHKSISNRLLEPFAHMVTIVSATDFKNFFGLRAHPDAQPEFQELAYLMLQQYVENQPRPRTQSEWHLPLIKEDERNQLPIDTCVRMCVARCARVSYINFKTSTVQQDLDLHDRLSTSGHWSPFEHAAQPTAKKGDRRGNFKGWRQYRQHFQNENREDTDLIEIYKRRLHEKQG